MDAIQDSLLTSSDYEHLIEDLRKGNSEYQLHGNQGYVHIEKTEAHVMVQDETNPPILEDFSHVQNQGKHIDNDMQIHGDLSRPIENYMPQVINEVVSTTPLTVSSLPYSPTCTIPCRDNYLGPFNFELFLDSTSSHRRSWVYSHILNKVFIDVEKSLLVQFRTSNYINGLSVRALPVYSMDDDISTPVQRCLVHAMHYDVLRKAHSKDHPNMCYCANFKWVRHVVQSNHSQAQYEYDHESDRHSVRVPLEMPQAGCDTAMVKYHFTCKTSCPTGMNRKPIDVIFTLETEQREVLGRFVLAVKICSCPKRDKEKEESDFKSKNEHPLHPKSGSAKRRISSSVEKNEISKKIKIETITPQKNGVTHEETNKEDNKVESSEVLKTLVSQNAEILQQLKEMKAELKEMKAEMEKQREETHIIYNFLGKATSRFIETVKSLCTKEL